MNDLNKKIEGEQNKEMLLNELKSLLSAAMKKDSLGVQDKMVKKVEEVRKVYLDYQKYEMYHLLVGSGLIGTPEYFDFPGNDSIEKFIRSL